MSKKIVFLSFILISYVSGLIRGGMNITHINTGNQDKLSNIISVNIGNNGNSNKDIYNANIQIDQKETIYNGDIFAHFSPPTQPPAKGKEAFVTIQNNYQYYIDTLWEPLRSENSDYITRTILGKDHSGTYDIYEYVFKPKKYEKTIILNCTTHGNEIEGMLAVYRFMYLICNNYKEYPQLDFIRNHVRIVVIPILNPWGVQKGSRENSRGVDLNRNMNVNWKNTSGAKGTSPLSEAEAIIVDKVMQKYSDAIAFFDVHSSSPDGINDFYYVIPRYADNIKNIYREVAERIKPNAKLLMSQVYEAFICCQASHYYNMSSSTLEWMTGVFGTPLDSKDITASVEWVANVVIAHLKYSKPSIELLSDPYGVYLYCNGGYSTTSTTWEYISNLEVELNVPADGIVLITGSITTHNTDESALTYIAPVLIQEGNDVIPLNSISSQLLTNDLFGEFGGKQGTLNFSNLFKVYGESSIYKKPKIRIYWYTTSGTLKLKRLRLNAVFIPSEKARRFTRYANNGVNKNIEDYPALK